ncbi:MAG: dynamin family protein [Polyangiaceae bacterium]
MRLSETVARWVGRVEIALSGAEGLLVEAEEALAMGDAMRARTAAHALLRKAPGSPTGLALLADACELGGLEAELTLTLEELARRMPDRGNVWLRLARARASAGSPDGDVRDAYLKALASAQDDAQVRKHAVLGLADLDITRGDGRTAELWLERIPFVQDDDVRLRRAEAWVLGGKAALAEKELAEMSDLLLEPRGALTYGRALLSLGDTRAFSFLLRAYLLDADGSADALATSITWLRPDAETLSRIRTVVEAKSDMERLAFRVAFARAAGDHEGARNALTEATKAQLPGAAMQLLLVALADRDVGTLSLALGAVPSEDLVVQGARTLARALESDGEAAIALCNEITAPEVVPWAQERRKEALRSWVPEGKAAEWPLLLARLEGHARALSDLSSLGAIGNLAVERSRPLRIAIVGEFNAGKSTFINALLGEDVAPTGILPTTGTLHHLRYAASPAAKIFLEEDATLAGQVERIVATSDLRATLKALDPGTVRRVEILVPLPMLTRVEILDTPGFNAPDPRHARAAREAFDEADAVLWLLDAGQALKDSERSILDEIRAAGLPLQLLVNKGDRLSQEQRETVMKALVQNIEELGLRTLRPPMFVSAKNALAGKLGDEALLASSGFREVEALLDQEFEGRAEHLKERALRRRARTILGHLGRAVARRTDEEASLVAAQEAKRDRSRAARARLALSRTELSIRMAEGLGSASRAWTQDIDSLRTGRDREASERDASLLAFARQRAVERLALPLAVALSECAPSEAPAPALLPLTRIIAASFAAGMGLPTEPLPELLPLAEASLDAFELWLVEREAQATRERMPDVLGELRDLEGCLAK